MAMTVQQLYQAVRKQYRDLLEVFHLSVEAFNLRHWDTLKGLYADNVTIGPVGPVGDISPQGQPNIVTGKQEVIDYLEKMVTDRGGVPLFTPTSPICVDIRRGIVSGTAIWHDKQADGTITDLPIPYSFICTPDPDKGWLILNLWASED